MLTVRDSENEKRPRDDDFLLRCISDELAVFRAALLKDIATSNDQLKHAIAQLLRRSGTGNNAYIATTNDQVKQAIDHLWCRSGTGTSAVSSSAHTVANTALRSSSTLFENDTAGLAHPVPRFNSPGRCAMYSEGGLRPSFHTNGFDLTHALHTNVPVHKTRAIHGKVAKLRRLFTIDSVVRSKMNDLGEPLYDVSHFYKATGVFRWVATSHIFHTITMFIICLNAVFIGLAANEDRADNMLDRKRYFDITENLFCGFFLGELLIRFCAFERKLDCVKDAWFKFDTFLVLMMLSETVPRVAGGDSGNRTGVFRVFRLMRLARMTRLMSVVPELVTMMKGMFCASRAVASSLLLVIALIYVFGIALHALLSTNHATAQYFETVPRSMWTLLLNGVFMDNLGVLIRLMVSRGEVFGVVVFILFVMLSAVTVMNMLVGVMCEVIAGVAAEEKKIAAIHEMKSTLLVLLKRLDTDGSGDITRHEFQCVLRDPETLAVLEDLQVDTSHVLGLMEMEFASIESQGCTNEPSIGIPQIMEILLANRGDNVATVQDCIHCHTYTRWCLDATLERQTQELQDFLLNRLSFGDGQHMARNKASDGLQLAYL